MTDTSSLQHTLTFSNTKGATEPASVQLVVDEANPTVPPMIIQRILGGEYVEIVELCPRQLEELLVQPLVTLSSCPGSLQPKKRPVIEILS